MISIIVPVYNMEDYLERCMDSVLSQTYVNLEIIVVDDGSTDRSPQLCDAYARRDGRVRVIHKPNGGLSDARNAGLEAATGLYIGYVDSDDWIEPDMYERMHRACVETGSQLAVCRYFSERAGLREDGGSGEVVPLSREELLRLYICGHDRYVIYNSVWSKLFHRDLVRGARFPKGRNSEDIMYTTRAFCRLSRAVYLDTSLYHYVLDREGSIMNRARGERMFRDEIPFWREHISHIRAEVSDEMGDLAAYRFWRRMLGYYLELSGRRETRADAKRLAEMLQTEAAGIRHVYAEACDSRGDAVRMKLFLCSPLLYRAANGLYARTIVPVKRRMQIGEND
ncbi:MAG: glycosyltransferase [Roseburia sp.]|nr:glycosyltransferase [Roseburia sp.]